MMKQWLIGKGIAGDDGQKIPEITTEVANDISKQYIDLYEAFTSNRFLSVNTINISQWMFALIVGLINKLINS